MWGGLLGNKRPDRGKKNFRGPEIFGGGGLFGEMQKRGWKTFWGSVGGAVTPKNFRGEFLEKCQRKKFGGEILGVVRRGACDAVGMVRNEKKGKFSPK